MEKKDISVNGKTEELTQEQVASNEVKVNINIGKDKDSENEAAETPDELTLLRNELEKAKQQLAESQDKHLRLLAEFTNFRTRKAKEFRELTSTASKKVIIELLPVLDDFERAFKAAGDKMESEENKGYLLIFQKLMRNLEKRGLKVMETKGKVFDPELHQAITEIPAPTKDLKGKVIDETEKGYYLKDTIIRYAKVVVGK